jgi:formate hydrogenlyase subunit 5
VNAPTLVDEIRSGWEGTATDIRQDPDGLVAVDVRGDPGNLCHWLVREKGFQFTGMAVRETGAEWSVHYLLYSQEKGGPWITLTLRTASTDARLPSISSRVHAADWQERESEDHFGILFEGHPRLGDFVLHDEEWGEGVAPMRGRFDARRPVSTRQANRDWRPRRILHTPGAFAMTVGPVYGGLSEPVHFILESVGEDVVRAYPRLFYKYRAIEKMAEGKSVDDALLLAERFNAAQAFAHSFAYCQAIERISRTTVPDRAQRLRIALAELERLRSHVGSIRAICGSTGLAVAESQAAILEEDLLRACGAFTGHRYLFGLNVPGGLSRDFSEEARRDLLSRVELAGASLRRLNRMLSRSSSFLDRLEEVGTVSSKQASDHGLVGPVARASGLPCDLRSVHPYSGYGQYRWETAREDDGDGYARLRVLFFETEQCLSLIGQAAAGLPEGPVREAPPLPRHPASAFGCVEAAAGAALHWLWLDEQGRISRYRVVPPSFVNWHGFHLAAEGFAFQDFPIILATFALSVAENDR